MSYNIVYDYYFFKWHNFGALSTIAKISEKELSVEPFNQSWKVSEWPGNVREYQMVVDGRTWSLNKATTCR
jgi:hypothetical protein